jgi:hypothetical protein
MNLVFNTSPATLEGIILPGAYSRSFRSGAQQTRLWLNFSKDGVILVNPATMVAAGLHSRIRFKPFGQVLRIHEEGESKTLAYYSYFYAERFLHLCALSDDNIGRKMALNGSWRLEHEVNENQMFANLSSPVAR